MKSTVILKASLINFTVFIFSLYRSLLFKRNKIIAAEKTIVRKYNGTHYDI